MASPELKLGYVVEDALVFRGGTVAGSIHLELFPPPLIKHSASDGLSAALSRCTS
jgi:hypothetical protein